MTLEKTVAGERKRMEQEDNFKTRRLLMVKYRLEGQGIADRRVLEVMKEMPRHEFIDEDRWNLAYEDSPLPIACDQAISQPYMVALMTEKLELKPQDKILEIGTGSGYQTAILARLAKWVYSLERHRSLIDKARTVLRKLSIENVTLLKGDGSCGYAKKAPYDKIIVTAAASETPREMLKQLADDGIMVIPIGVQGRQDLMIYRKKGSEVTEKADISCTFVPLVGRYST